jgi:hypothetical protein
MPENCKLLRVEVNTRDILNFVLERNSGEQIYVAIARQEMLDMWVDASLEKHGKEDE